MVETTAIVANISLTLSLIVALIFGIAQVRAAARDRKERLTIDTIRNFHTREFSELIHYVTTRKMPSTMKEMQALPDNDRIVIIQFAQQMESLGILVAERMINIDLVDKTLGSLVSGTWEKYKPAMQDIRKNQPDPFLAEYFQWLAERVAERLKNNPRKPFHEGGESPKV